MRLCRFAFALVLGAVLVSGETSAAVSTGHSRAVEPALWEVSAGASTVFLFGSLHMLPPDWRWRTKAIDAAIGTSDRFYFETSLTPATLDKLQHFIRAHGQLPRGRSLSRMLSPEGLKTFEKILAKTPLDPESVDSMRPWLALTMLSDYQVRHGPLRSFTEEGVDYRLEQQLLERGKPVGYFETPEVQLNVLMQMTPDGDIPGFEQDLRDLLSVSDTYRRVLESWTAGNQAELARILVEEAVKNPQEKQLLLDGRNRNWLPQIERMMLSKETIFVTVGAAHLVGPGSIIDMLCVRGWKVQRIKTGPTAPPTACPSPKLATPMGLRPSIQ